MNAILFSVPFYGPPISYSNTLHLPSGKYLMEILHISVHKYVLLLIK